MNKNAAISLISQKRTSLSALSNLTNLKTLASIIRISELSAAHISCSWQPQSVLKNVLAKTSWTCYLLIHTAEMCSHAFLDPKPFTIMRFSARMISSSVQSFRVPWARKETPTSKPIFGLSLRAALFDLECSELTKMKMIWWTQMKMRDMKSPILSSLKMNLI